MPFIYRRTVWLQDTDAAGVVYFANLLVMCHEAYEAALIATGISLRQFLGNAAIALPIVHASADYFRPMFCGDECLIQLTPQRLTEAQFEVSYTIMSAQDRSHRFGQAQTRHVCIDPMHRTKKPLPEEINQWLVLGQVKVEE